MFSMPVLIAAAIKVNFDALRISRVMANQAFENFERFAELQMTAGKAVLAESIVAMNGLCSVKSAEEFCSLRAEERRHSIVKTIAYSRRVSDLASSIFTDCNTIATTQLAQSSREISALAESIAGHIPAGSEHAMALVKSSISNINTGYSQLTKMTGHAVELLGGQMTKGANHQFSHSVETSPRRAGEK